MRKILSVLFLAAAFSGPSAVFAAAAAVPNPFSSGPNAAIFQDDLPNLDAEFSGLNELETTVTQTGSTASGLAAQNNPLLRHLSGDRDLASSLLGAASPKDERLLGIPGFLWGFCFGLLGVVLVYVAIDDDEIKKREGKKALIGCAVGTVIGTLIYVLAFAAAANSSSTTNNSESCN